MSAPVDDAFLEPEIDRFAREGASTGDLLALLPVEALNLALDVIDGHLATMQKIYNMVPTDQRRRHDEKWGKAA